MFLTLHEYYHVYNRGNNKQRIFFSDRNYLFFIQKLREQLLPVVDIVAYCLMPNHFHLIIFTNEKSVKERKSFGGKPMQELAYRVGILLSSYAQAINKQNNTTGSLFQQKTKYKVLSAQENNRPVSYLENCFFYIHYNPVEAGLVNDLTEWPFSSFPDYAGSRNGTLCRKELFYRDSGLSVEEIQSISNRVIPVTEISKFT